MREKTLKTLKTLGGGYDPRGADKAHLKHALPTKENSEKLSEALTNNEKFDKHCKSHENQEKNNANH